MNFFKNMLSSGSKISSKRTVTFICLLFMLIGYTANLFWDFTVDTKYNRNSRVRLFRRRGYIGYFYNIF